MRTQSGFTLVELAIVMICIGLVSMAVLKGKDYIINSRISSTIAQVQSYQQAMQHFEDTYRFLPGDLPSANIILPNCDNVRCNTNAGGNNVIGSPSVAPAFMIYSPTANTMLTATHYMNDGGVQRETVLFWSHLLKADLIGGISPDGYIAANAEVGITNPATPFGGGFMLWHWLRPQHFHNGATTTDPDNYPSGPMVIMAPYISTTTGRTLSASNGTLMIAPAVAARFDRKMDDGLPASGRVHAYGNSCILNPADPIYAEANANLDCGLGFRLR